MTAVKICGITNLKDAIRAVEYGADALGFNFYQKSPRYIEKELAKKIIRELPPFITTVGVFVNEKPKGINAIVNYTGIMVIQLHGDEDNDVCKKLDRPIIKAIRIRSEDDIKSMKDYKVNAFLLDSYTPKYGGSAKSFAWDIAVRAKEFGRIILAGGLSVENVESAIKKVGPYGVDICSGVESAPGKKDHKKMKEFIKRVKRLL